MSDYYQGHPDYYDQLVVHHQYSDIAENVSRISNLVLKNNVRRILDVGCGSGDLCILLSERLKQNNYDCQIYGTDISRYATELAGKRALERRVSCKFSQWDAVDEPPFSEGFFDFVTLMHALEHITEPGKALLNLKKILKVNGILFLTFPGLFKCFSMPFTKNGIPIKKRILKIYDTLRMIFDNKYIRFRFTRPKLKDVLEDVDMVFLTYTPEIVRFLEQNGFNIGEVDVRGFILAFHSDNTYIPRLSRKLLYLRQFFAFFINLIIRKLKKEKCV